ncbi:hypothetical protein L6452_23945 [Arctium lappa]|uniref:Uncharacterized protein n=1 Tax=Arctium lappa TaxID=4217 RepID=A0ACB9A962_ARCLA|nr:hypothetical protein L6452_23945 [Arctium lappa]
MGECMVANCSFEEWFSGGVLVIIMYMLTMFIEMRNIYSSDFIINHSSFMEAMKMMKLFAVMVVMMMAVSAVSAADAPAPSPTSDATTVFIPTAIASLSALVFAFLF